MMYQGLICIVSIHGLESRTFAEETPFYCLRYLSNLNPPPTCLSRS